MRIVEARFVFRKKRKQNLYLATIVRVTKRSKYRPKYFFYIFSSYLNIVNVMQQEANCFRKVVILSCLLQDIFYLLRRNFHSTKYRDIHMLDKFPLCHILLFFVSRQQEIKQQKYFVKN